MAIQIQLSNEQTPHRVNGNSSAVVHAIRTRNGDVEITRTLDGDDLRVLTVIPKEKRAELAQFLISND